jgi:hypothetical protein
MSNLDFFDFEFFGSIILFATAIVPLFAEWHDWLPDFTKQFGTYLKDSFLEIASSLEKFVSTLITAVKDFIGKIIEQIIAFATGIYDLISSLWGYLKEAFQSILYIFGAIWEWFKSAIETCYEYITESLESLWELFSDTLLSLWETCLEWVWYCGEWLWEFLLSFFDWGISMGLEFFKWVIDQLPEIELPDGFNQGLSYFIDYGMVFNEILPIKETFALFAIYVTILLVLIIFRTIKTLIHFIPTI